MCALVICCGETTLALLAAPLPTCPKLSKPQQYNLPVLRIAHVWELPAEPLLQSVAVVICCGERTLALLPAPLPTSP